MPAPRYHPFARLFICALGLLAANIAMGVMLYFGSTLSTAWTGRKPEEQLVDLAARFALPLTLLSYPASLLWVAYCRTSLDGCSLASLGLRARRALPNAARGALSGALAIGALWLILWLSGVIAVVGWSPEAFEMSPGRVAINLIGYALAFAAVGFFEEVLFRGYALHNLNQWLGWPGAVAAQAALFAVAHLGNLASSPSQDRLTAIGALPSLVLIAVFFAICYRKTGSLWFPIGFHAAWNFCLGCVYSLPVSGIDTFRLLDVQNPPVLLAFGRPIRRGRLFASAAHFGADDLFHSAGARSSSGPARSRPSRKRSGSSTCPLSRSGSGRGRRKRSRTRKPFPHQIRLSSGILGRYAP